MASYQFKDTVFSTDTELAQPQLGTLTQVAENNLLSTRDYTLIATVTNINTNVVVQLDGSIDVPTSLRLSLHKPSRPTVILSSVSQVVLLSSCVLASCLSLVAPLR